MPTKLTITVSPEAETKIEVSGVTGSGCKALLAQVGGKPVAPSPK